MTRNTLIIGARGLAVILVVLGVALTRHAPPAPAPAVAQVQAAMVDPRLNAEDLNVRFLALQINPPDAQMQQTSNTDCSAGTGLYTTRCELSFTDAARYGQTDDVVIYLLRQDSDFAALQKQMETSLDSLPNSERIKSTGDTVTVTSKSNQVIGNIGVTCEQSIGNGVASDGVCIAHYAQGIAIGATVFPLNSLGGVNAEHPPDLERAEALLDNALLAINDAIGTPGT